MMDETVKEMKYLVKQIERLDNALGELKDNMCDAVTLYPHGISCNEVSLDKSDIDYFLLQPIKGAAITSVETQLNRHYARLSEIIKEKVDAEVV